MFDTTRLLRKIAIITEDVTADEFPKRDSVREQKGRGLVLLKRWKAHPEWTVLDAVRELGEKESTLRKRKKKY
ncbi:hypothetical protein PC129_g7770 [Phytophthora cactorum]|uniref:Uncharacterized protein n=1 Tax=Phytophthora cactorum TaxID=29920 RepID=A0A329RNB8_9STRA|nr:hypothetical protein Pcac1_g14831 [Phytophthora cactorum]KAG2810103.1 hypothetical protein PC112_g16206 [Phytophthora cactorum]KAG2857969.1 hypothetical protein PC113_g10226 [Phytophthora cactorum]KAG2936081.1 hypothetical protein PC115_g4681 [Phytophthora cactorum]KAG2941097.1 hypothetical protein PC117_g10329 [Phytophthora cactorum]